MGRAFAGDWILVDLFCALAAVATGVAIVATISASAWKLAGFASWFVFAQASFVQTDADVWGGEINQRR